MKTKKQWSCSSCGVMFPKWEGKCSSCDEWNTLVEEIEKTAFVRSNKEPISLNKISCHDYIRDLSPFTEFDRLMGGGVVPGSLTIIGGDPGMGKSTLLLHIADHYTKNKKVVLYICGEESEQQVYMRARRLGINSAFFVLHQTNFTAVMEQITLLKPDMIVLDSIQIVSLEEIPSHAGSVTQVKEIARRCMEIAKSQQITFFLIGHVTKSKELAGPKVLEHLVDTVLDFEGARESGLRLLRVRKNRFGPTDEVALFHMKHQGLVEEKNPSQLLLKQRNESNEGSAVICQLEGSRPLLVEIQSLVAPSSYATSARRSTGVDSNRLLLLLAVLEKKVGYSFHQSDIFVSATGGIKASEPAADLGIIAAITSSYKMQSLPNHAVFIGEVGLSGEIRPVPRLETRIKEAKHLGFTDIYVPKRGTEKIEDSLIKDIKLHPCDRIESFLEMLFSC